MELKTLEEYNKIFQEAIGRVVYRERKARTGKFTTFCYENDIPKTTMNSLENGKNDPRLINSCRIMNCMGVNGVLFMELVAKELPENFWEEWRLAESEKDRKNQDSSNG